VGSKHSYFIASLWAKRQRVCLSFEAEVGPGTCHQIGYEPLISAPQHVLSRLCEFVGIDYHNNMLSPQHSHESLKAANVGKQWRNLVKPVMNDNSGGYKTKLTARDIHIVETCALDEMNVLGYQPDMHPNHGAIVFNDDDMKEFSAIDEALKRTMANDNSDAEITSKIKMTAIKNSIVERYDAATV